jgi:hypothetical protein
MVYNYGEGWYRMRKLLFLLLIFALSTIIVASNSQPRIIDLNYQVNYGQLFASCKLKGAISQEVLHSIKNGSKVTLEYFIELKRSRKLWLDEAISMRIISVGIKYDSLTKQYNLTRAIDGKVINRYVTGSAEEMKKWVCNIPKLRLFSIGKLPQKSRYYLQVRANLSSPSFYQKSPWDLGTFWKKSTLFTLNQ